MYETRHILLPSTSCRGPMVMKGSSCACSVLPGECTANLFGTARQASELSTEEEPS
jgi:hypothetical protein